MPNQKVQLSIILGAILLFVVVVAVAYHAFSFKENTQLSPRQNSQIVDQNSETIPQNTTPQKGELNALITTPSPLLLPSPSPSPSPSPHAGPLIQNVYVVTYYAGHNPSGTFDVTALADQFATELTQVSHGTVKFHIVQRKTIPNTAPQLGTQCDQYLGRVQSGKWSTADWQNTQCWGSGTANYPQMLADNHVCDLVNAGSIDEVWFFGFGNGGFWEANMTGTGAFFTNGPIVSGTSCRKPTHILGLNYELPVDYALHSFGHRVEGTMRRFLPQEFASFQIYGQTKNSCGNVHFPPNGTKDYDYANQTSVSSDCGNWTPNHTGSYQMVSCHTWECNQLGYMRWWLGNVPLNWWPTIVKG